MNYKKWVLIAILLFSLGMVLTFVTPSGTISVSLPKELLDILVPFKPLTAILILARNTLVLLLSFILSPILCLMPILSLVFNGMLLSFISALVIQEESVGLLLAGILPHGIFEIPALILGNAAALSFGATVLLALFKRRNGELLLPSLKRHNQQLSLYYL